MSVKHPKLTFSQLVSAIREADHYFSSQANRAVNVSLTLRNWIVGYYISEFELHGKDRADYGEKLLSELAKELGRAKISNCEIRQLYDYIKFYRVYPEIVRTLSAQFKPLMSGKLTIHKEIVPTASAQFSLPPDKLITGLSYSMFKLLAEIDDPLKRVFYEIESIRGNWSVRDLKRQIASLYFERSGLSKNKKKLATLTQKNVQGMDSKLTIRDPYIFEFLGIKAKEVMAESTLEAALLNKLQDFLFELGHGFCFEASQKRILIDGKHYFVDLVFYHRILKCHVLIELKVDEFNHEHLGQLNTYVSWFRKNMTKHDDNQPVGILLCTKKNHALAEYALAGMNNKLFVSKYQVELPKKKEIEKFLEATLKTIE
ncbi:MAG: cytoplasmic protein [Deltaproteobacteria bacterium RIFCSPLOWO2_12_FULL_40_28]|nr:MAG: cytoplasmic protein [Deltaproteobacteria bacterium RIFCSPHIGHO2_02_FULL_40_28]OGQ19145.1 MAG: cytoplasmic protein [Deltaproteobacteria bacterium RIFCSPHIGHO2_12_FULL_40_32]OGQ40317.1 MAG: cytoplasmic protein [Deltaproteobacteria bacterium RIFCSPLOWO2_02_FULL_40_36]OGQ53588.1 MAG: cytoplasmic protein [Deltaproteobacteria bacterium RIFCSPLOWO2_12_FULL_40_28]